MDFFSEIFNNGALGISLIACFLAQFIKIFTGKEKRIELSRILISGGMPSSHSSFVTSLATVVGIEKGFNSTDFAIITVLALIIMYDAAGVRRAVGKQATILNQMVADIQHGKHIEHKKLKELIGHTPLEVWFGALLGIVTALILM
ncbi:TPA: divergent PAP2 family protein [Clostridioides difficile]|nr:divergent PAP2 family protein [Clostridioides difficile]